jgi:hypothetical protein
MHLSEKGEKIIQDVIMKWVIKRNIARLASGLEGQQ